MAAIPDVWVEKQHKCPSFTQRRSSIWKYGRGMDLQSCTHGFAQVIRSGERLVPVHWLETTSIDAVASNS